MLKTAKVLFVVATTTLCFAASARAAVSSNVAHKHNLREIQPRTFQLIDDRSGHTPITEVRGNPRSTTYTSEQPRTAWLVNDVSPGMVMGYTSYDYQHNGSDHHQIAVDTATGRVHASWTYWEIIPEGVDDADRSVVYNMWDPATMSFAADSTNPKPLSGVDLRGGYTTLDLFADGRAVAAFHQQDSPGGIYSPVISRQTLPGHLLFNNTIAVNPAGEEQLWPVIDVATFADVYSEDIDTTDVVHMVTADFENTDNYAYYRGVYRPLAQPAFVWSVPVTPFTGTTISAVVTDDPTDDDVAMAWCKRLDDMSTSQVNSDIAYILSTTNGADWVAGMNLDPSGTINITNYDESSGYRSYTEVAAIFDFTGELHIVWNGRRVEGDTFFLNQCALFHWSPSTGTNLIERAFYEPGGACGKWCMNLCKVTIGVGAPGGLLNCSGEPIEDYLYALYTKFGGETPEEVADFSSRGWNNGELYLTASRDGGTSWGHQINLTNTKTPDCDTTLANRCASEHWSSIARVVNDTAHIFYIADQDAGAVNGPEGLWTINPVKYLRLDGTILCPVIVPEIEVNLSVDPRCEYHATPGGVNFETLTVENLGNAELTYDIAVTDDGDNWLDVSGPLSNSIPPGGQAVEHQVTMDAASLSQGVYMGNITVTHNDTSAAPLSFDIAFFVFEDFSCPDEITLNTGTQWLTVSNELSVGRDNDFGGLWRPGPFSYTTGVGGTDTIDEFNPLTDASLLIGRIDGNDTLVYRDIFNNVTGTNPGFRPLTSLAVDTSAYGTNMGFASASATTTTIDSLIGIDVVYVFPQHPDSSEFVILKWRIYNRTANPLMDLLVGAAADFDVHAQNDVDNKGESNGFYNLLYQVGLDTDFAGQSTTKNFFSAGLSSIQCAPTSGRTSDNASHVYPQSGFLDGYLYDQLSAVAFADSDSLSDLHTIVSFDQDLDLVDAIDFGWYCAALVSSVVGEAELLETTKKAWKYCFGWQILPQEVLVDFNTGEVVSVPFVASGSHENGHEAGAGCCGCIISFVGGTPPGYSLGTSAGECKGHLIVDGSIAQPMTITLRVQDICQQYSDDCAVLVRELCDCPRQGDVAPLPGGDGVVNVLDVIAAIDHVFRSGPSLPSDEPICANARADVSPRSTCGDGTINVLDVIELIDNVFRSGPPLCDPCSFI